MEIKRITTVDDELVKAFHKLLPQLSETAPLPTKADLEKIISNENTHLFTAIENNNIIGTLTLAFYQIPTGKKAWIEDVVVDSSARGKDVAKKMCKHAIAFAQKLGFHKIDLTTSYSRTAANQLYQKLGFLKRESNLYRYEK